MSSRKTRKQRRIKEVVQMLADYDTLIFTELSRLGRSTAEVIALVNELVARNIRVIILKQNLDISQHDMSSKIVIPLFSLFAELERDLISLRTKEALAAKKLQGVKLGKPKGTIQKSKFDADRERIKELLTLGLSVRKIAKLLGYPNHCRLTHKFARTGRYASEEEKGEDMSQCSQVRIGLALRPFVFSFYLLCCPIPMNIGTGRMFADLGDLSGKKATLTHIPAALTHISA